MPQLVPEDSIHRYTSLSIARYSFTQSRNLEQCKEKQHVECLTQLHRIQTRFLIVETETLATAPLQVCFYPTVDTIQWYVTNKDTMGPV